LCSANFGIDRIRSEQDFNTLTLLSASIRQPLITFWTASWCPSCRVVRPLIKDALESGVGEAQGGVGFAEVEVDAPDAKDVGLRYLVGRDLVFGVVGDWGKKRLTQGGRSIPCPRY